MRMSRLPLFHYLLLARYTRHFLQRVLALDRIFRLLLNHGNVEGLKQNLFGVVARHHHQTVAIPHDDIAGPYLCSSEPHRNIDARYFKVGRPPCRRTVVRWSDDIRKWDNAAAQREQTLKWATRRKTNLEFYA